MAYLALYRKYRPTTFDNLIGQEHIVKTLTNQIISGRLGHAYLFTGTRGTGKTSAAKIFARAINCLDNVNGSPCGKCESCKALADVSNIDIIEIDAASNNGVNEIRDLREKVQYPPVSCKYKVYIVDEVHMLTGAAFNALLKTLEEPPKHAVFILATTEVHKIPATILSRCMRFDFRLISTERIASLISSIYDEYGKKYEKEAVFALAKAGEGSIRDALSVADIALSCGSDILTYNDVMDILGSSNIELLNEFVVAIIKSNSGCVLEIIDKLSALGKSMGVLIKDITSYIRDLLVVKTCSNPNDILKLPKNKFDELVETAAFSNDNRLLRILSIFSDAENALKYSNHPRVVFETAAIKATMPDSDYNIDALLSRIKILEEKVVAVKQCAKVENTIVQKNNEINSFVKEVIVQEEKTIEKEDDSVEKIVAKTLDTCSVEEVKGKLLFNLRKINSEVLWNIVQGVELKVKGNTVYLISSNQSDTEFLETDINKDKITTCLEEFKPFNLVIQISDMEKKLDAIDDATERIKKIFGDDIVIVK